MTSLEKFLREKRAWTKFMKAFKAYRRKHANLVAEVSEDEWFEEMGESRIGISAAFIWEETEEGSAFWYPLSKEYIDRMTN